MTPKLIALLLCLGATMLLAEPVRFDNYRLYEVSIANRMQLEALQLLEQYPDGVSEPKWKPKASFV